MRAGPPILLLVLLFAAAACGPGEGGDGAAERSAVLVETVETAVAEAPPGSIAALLAERPGDDVAIVNGAADFAVGENRLPFLIVRPDGRLLESGRARVLVARGGLDAVPELEATAEALPTGIEGGDDEPEGGDFDAPSIWVTHLTLDEPGLYTLLVEPEGEALQAFGQIQVEPISAAPGVGVPAIPSDNPTLDGGFAEDLTTARPPDVELLRYSIEDSISEGVPFVAVFATPLYCTSRVCGPQVDIVDEVRRRLEGTGVRFIHVEIFEGNDPGRGFNRWVREWNLPTEPWTFLVDGEGIVRARFEGLVTAGELEEAVRAHLL